MGNFTIFQTSVSALGANAQAISVASNNIANVNTPGYSKQIAVLSSRNPQSIGGFEVGLGVQVNQVKRLYNVFAELQLREAASSKSEADANARVLQQIASTFNEVTTDGLAKFTSGFFNAIQEVAADPSSITARQNALGSAEILINRFHTLSSKLTEARTLNDGDIASSVEQINTLAGEIVDLNQRIQSLGDGADLTYRDQRAVKLRELSNLIDVQAIETSEGIFQVYVAGGVQMVNGTSQAVLSVSENVNNDNLYDINYSIGGSTATNITNRITGGALKGLVNVRDTIIPGYQDQLDEYAFTLSREFNAIHTSGYDLDGNTLGEFFDEDSFNLNDAVGATLATDLKDSSGAHLRIKVGDSITVSGTIGAAFSSSFVVGATTSLTDIATQLQVIIRANGVGTETVTVEADGSLEVTAGATAISGLQLDITGKAAFNTAFTFDTPIAIAGTGNSETVHYADFEGAARLMSLDSFVEDHPDGIAAASTAADLPGGNDNAQALAGLQSSAVSFGRGDLTFSDYYGDFLTTIGLDTNSYTNRASFANDVYQQSEIQRERISGVSLEEEQLDLVKFQSAFEAAARLIQIASDILDTLTKLG